MRKGLALAGLIAIILLVIGWRVFKSPEPPRERELTDAVLTELNVASRSAEIEFVHPKSGRTMRLRGQAAPNCEILINNQPADLSELRVGDNIDVRGFIHRHFTTASVEATWVHAHRPTAQSRPTAKPDDANPGA